jgi:hypothetical protein
MKGTPLPTDDTYTGVGETESTCLMANFLASSGIPVKVTNARTIGLSELAGQNLVVLSSLRFQTLLRGLGLPTAFEVLPTTVIRNRRILAGEQDEYAPSSGTGVDTAYALASLWPGVTAGRRILHIGGAHTWTTQAAAEFLLQGDRLRELGQEFEKDRNGARGQVSPYFQIVLRVEARNNRSQKVEYVTHRYLPASTTLGSETVVARRP